MKDLEKRMTLLFKIKKPSNQVFDILSDMNKFTEVHPVISEIKSIKDGSYLIHETLKFGFIPFSFTYPATVESINPNKVSFQATVMKVVTIKMDFNIQSDNDHSIIEEKISIKSILPVKGIIRKVFKEQHEKLFKNIEDHNPAVNEN